MSEGGYRDFVMQQSQQRQDNRSKRMDSMNDQEMIENRHCETRELALRRDWMLGSMTDEEIKQQNTDRNEADKRSRLQKRLDVVRVDTTFQADGDLEKKLNSFKKLHPISGFKIMKE
ncbi:hypothetical protein MP228_005303 [Amoeboaphelidium protococcarum]|nr:hypothetical protein MP228_005303 [Amoeboaphelidium protococcarum]